MQLQPLMQLGYNYGQQQNNVLQSHAGSELHTVVIIIDVELLEPLVIQSALSSVVSISTRLVSHLHAAEINYCSRSHACICHAHMHDSIRVQNCSLLKGNLVVWCTPILAPNYYWKLKVIMFILLFIEQRGVGLRLLEEPRNK